MTFPAGGTIYERMVAVIDELPAIDKTQRNEQQGFMFRGHDDVLNALNPLLAKHGVFCAPDVLERQTSERHTANGKIMWEVSLHVRFTFYGLGGDSFAGSTWGEGTDMGDKATSKAMTMAFKSMLNQTFAISNKEAADPDGETAEPVAAAAPSASRPAANGAGAVISDPQRKRLFAIAKSKGVDNATVARLTLEIAGVHTSAEVPKSKYEALVNAVEAGGAAPAFTCEICGTHDDDKHSDTCPNGIPF